MKKHENDQIHHKMIVEEDRRGLRIWQREWTEKSQKENLIDQTWKKKNWKRENKVCYMVESNLKWTIGWDWLRLRRK